MATQCQFGQDTTDAALSTESYEGAALRNSYEVAEVEGSGTKELASAVNRAQNNEIAKAYNIKDLEKEVQEQISNELVYNQKMGKRQDKDQMTTSGQGSIRLQYYHEKQKEVYLDYINSIKQYPITVDQLISQNPTLKSHFQARSSNELKKIIKSKSQSSYSSTDSSPDLATNQLSAEENRSVEQAIQDLEHKSSDYRRNASDDVHPDRSNDNIKITNRNIHKEQVLSDRHLIQSKHQNSTFDDQEKTTQDKLQTVEKLQKEEKETMDSLKEEATLILEKESSRGSVSSAAKTVVYQNYGSRQSNGLGPAGPQSRQEHESVELISPGIQNGDQQQIQNQLDNSTSPTRPNQVLQNQKLASQSVTPYFAQSPQEARTLQDTNQMQAHSTLDQQHVGNKSQETRNSNVKTQQSDKDDQTDDKRQFDVQIEDQFQKTKSQISTLQSLKQEQQSLQKSIEYPLKNAESPYRNKDKLNNHAQNQKRLSGSKPISVPQSSLNTTANKILSSKLSKNQSPQDSEVIDQNIAPQVGKMSLQQPMKLKQSFQIDLRHEDARIPPHLGSRMPAAAEHRLLTRDQAILQNSESLQSMEETKDLPPFDDELKWQEPLAQQKQSALYGLEDQNMGIRENPSKKRSGSLSRDSSVDSLNGKKGYKAGQKQGVVIKDIEKYEHIKQFIDGFIKDEQYNFQYIQHK